MSDRKCGLVDRKCCRAWLSSWSNSTAKLFVPEFSVRWNLSQASVCSMKEAPHRWQAPLHSTRRNGMNRIQKVVLVTRRLTLWSMAALFCTISLFGIAFARQGPFTLSWFSFGCGVLGGFVSLEQRLKTLADEDLDLFVASNWSVVVVPLFGGVFALVLYLFFLSASFRATRFRRSHSLPLRRRQPPPTSFGFSERPGPPPGPISRNSGSGHSWPAFPSDLYPNSSRTQWPIPAKMGMPAKTSRKMSRLTPISRRARTERHSHPSSGATHHLSTSGRLDLRAISCGQRGWRERDDGLCGPSSGEKD